MYNVLSGLAACGRLGVAARPACLFVTRSSTRPAARDQRHASHVGATPADWVSWVLLIDSYRRVWACLYLARVLFSRLAGGYSRWVSDPFVIRVRDVQG